MSEEPDKYATNKGHPSEISLAWVYWASCKIPTLQAELKVHLENLNSQDAKIDRLEQALEKAGRLAEWDQWPTRHPLVYGSIVAALEKSDE